jgi:hypothetical protein
MIRHVTFPLDLILGSAERVSWNPFLDTCLERQTRNYGDPVPFPVPPSVSHRNHTALDGT